MLAVDDKGGNRGDAHLAELFVALKDGGLIRVAVQQAADDGGVHLKAIGQIGQNIAVANVAALFEIGFEQRDSHGHLPVFDARPMDQAVRVQRVGRACDTFEIDVKPRLLGFFHHRQVSLYSALLAAELGL